MKRSTAQTAPALLTLRAHAAVPACVELVYQAVPGRLARVLLSVGVFWGAIPVLMWVPPHYPWVIGAFVAGLYLSYRSWTGRYRVFSFSGACPRCGRELVLRRGTKINLPYTLTCFGCHFEPRLEVAPATSRQGGAPVSPTAPIHRDEECVGLWRTSRSAVVCATCGAEYPATPDTVRRAEQENERARILDRLAWEGRLLP